MEHKEKEGPYLEKLFEQKINKLINPTMSNKQFKELKPQYKFILDS